MKFFICELGLLFLPQIDMCWKEEVAMLQNISSLAALEVVVMTTSSAASDEKFINVMTYPLQFGNV